jgi:anti-anti-sigma factor
MHLGFATQDLNSDYWLIVTYGAQARATELGIPITTLPATTLDQQLEAIHTLIDRRVDVLLLGSVTSTGYAQAVDRARAAGIPVVTVTSLLRDCTVTSAVLPDHMRGAELAATHMVEQLNGVGAVAHLIGPNSFQECVDRATGVRKVLNRYSDIQLVFEAESPDWSSETASAIISQALERHPDLRGICAANDTLALGAVKALEAADRAGQVVVTGFDASPDALIAIQKGQMSASVRASMMVIGRTAVGTAMRIARGETVPPNIFSDTSLVSRANLAEVALESVYILPSILRSTIENGEALARVHDEVIHSQAATLQEISSPLIPISDTVMVMPLIGAIDERRAQHIMESLLEGISLNGTRLVILDITGVPLVDTQVANVLIQAAQAVKLLGAQVMLTGMRPEVAQALVGLGIGLDGIMTRSTVQNGIAYALEHV